MKRLLCLSNGHGEDAIASSILQALRQRCPHLDLMALPLVGLGSAYTRLGIPVLQPRKILPSGGFIYMDLRQLWRDLRAGLLGLLGAQVRAIQRWQRFSAGHLLAVGDIVPLLLAYGTGGTYSFIGTAKSDYYLYDTTGRPYRWGMGWAGSDYLPWERWLWRSPRCRGIFVRDELTAKGLRQFGYTVHYCGNPMMDLVMPPPERSPFTTRTIVLLPGSRAPEAYRNWQQILRVLAPYPDQPLTCLAAVSPSLDLRMLEQSLEGWQPIASALPQTSAWQLGQQQLILSSHHFREFLHWAEGGIALAGTATEQCVGLGKPVITFAGAGPQFTREFASRQKRLLGDSIFLLDDPQEAIPTLWQIWEDATLLARIAANGKERMGDPGASDRIAEQLLKILGIESC
ncbi:lipid-A-disaccharide synthase-related protein [Thermosynechococcus sp. PP22]|uniref:lipid-A-disaccharide synthase-related protein n=1 Tax=Thermosynechococcus sp. PP22 TaxID=3074082 RepID=UPI002873D74B|nr:lipid-A-disaccharide synthase-related protein [Thermosynechococcus sp. PP22]WNC22423.1 lipid-A-disaccharide synthase-related protein [Thermosynechococcus sp. PP22]